MIKKRNYFTRKVYPFNRFKIPEIEQCDIQQKQQKPRGLSNSYIVDEYYRGYMYDYNTYDNALNNSTIARLYNGFVGYWPNIENRRFLVNTTSS